MRVLPTDLQPDDPKSGYGYRPRSYWAEADPVALRRTPVKGSARRGTADVVADPGFRPHPEDLLFQESLSEPDRQSRAAAHPGPMGGEYLPDLERHEVEIARIEMSSDTGDVISVRARPVGDHIGYLVVDEEDDGTPLTCRPETPRRPLSMAELIALIDGIEGDEESPGVTNTVRNRLVDSETDLEEAAEFVSVSSDFYPDLHAHDDAEAEDWLRDAQKLRDDEDDDSASDQ
jgi:hypothetical protein